MIPHSTHPGLGDQLLAILSEYLSPINAHGILSRAISRAGGSGLASVDNRNLPEVLQRLQVSAGLFIATDRRVEFQDRLDALRGGDAPSRAPEAEKIPILEESDIVVARTRARILCEELGAGGVAAHKVATVVSELARNIVSYTPGGHIELTPSTSPRAITIEARDKGTGIPGLNAIMAGQYRSKTGLGLGLAGSKRLASSFHIDTGSGGTTIVARMNL